MRLRNLVAFAVAVLMALPVAAQEQRGSIEGVIKDAQGGAVPGVTVEAKNDSGAAVSATTDATGTYRFPSLVPGTYTVTARLSGFAPARVDKIRVGLGTLLTVNMSMKLGAMTETVEVTGEAPLIDTKQSARTHNFREEAITKMPKGRDFTSLVAQAPGVSNEGKVGGISIDGASGGENRYIIDGAEVTNLQAGTIGRQGTAGSATATVLVTDFVDEVQVKSSGYTAEYGGATGGVINAITKTGTNDWRGSGLVYYSSDALDGDPRPSLRLVPTNSRASEYVTYPKDEYSRVEPGFTIGGPLSKDKVWFFAGYNPAFRPLERSSKFNNGQPANTKADFTAHYAVANLTAQFNPKTRVKVAFNMNSNKTEGVLAAQDGSSSATANYGVNRVQPMYSTSATLDYTPSNKLYLSVRGAYYKSDVYNEGIYNGTRYLFQTSNVGQAGVPANLQGVGGTTNVPTNNSSQRDIQSRMQGQFDATYFGSLGGEHQLKFGVQYDRLGNDVLAGETGNLVRISWDRSLAGARGPFGYYQVRSNGVAPQLGFVTEGNVHVNNIGLFLQDSWTINNKFTVNLGIRTENETVPGFATGPGAESKPIEFSFGDKLAPRAGFAWDIKGDGKLKAYASWGIFYDIMKLELPRGSFGGDKWLEYYYTLDTPDWPNLDTASCPPACPGRLLRGPIDFRHPSTTADGSIDPNIKQTKSQELAAGFERELSNVLSLGVRYVHKQLDRVVEDIGAVDEQQNEIYTIGNPGEGLTEVAYILSNGTKVLLPKAKRDYDAVELSLNKRMANNWSGRFSYLWSRLYGNHTGLAQGDENGRTSPNVGRTYDVTYMMYDQNGQAVFGPLPTDRTHQLKAQLVYDFKFGTSAGLNWFGATGVPKSRQVAAIPPNNYPVQYLGRESDGRMPFYNQFDLYLQHEFKMTDRMRMTLSANVINVFDQSTAINYAPDELQGSGVNITEEQFYRGVNMQSLIGAGVANGSLVRSPLFLLDNAYQDPRSIRLGLRLTF